MYLLTYLNFSVYKKAAEIEKTTKQSFKNRQIADSIAWIFG